MSFQTRKVQKTGGSSYTISLPKAWIDKNGIEKNDTLGILSQPDGNLLITPQIKTERIQKIKEIDVEDFPDDNFLFRVLIGAYIMGFSIIIIKSGKKFEPHIRDTIRKFTQIAIGPEIEEESPNFIKIKDLVNPREMPFEKTIRRMYILAQGMFEDSMNAFKTSNLNLAENVIKSDNEIDRLHYLIMRQVSIALSDIILCQKMGVTLEDAVHFQQISRFLERIADHAVKISKKVINLGDSRVDDKIKGEIEGASNLSIELMNRSLDAWLQKDINLANECIELIKSLISTTEKISFSSSNNTKSSIAIGYIIESIRRTGEYSGDISEIIINSLI
ncbi:MAG: phosphate uptake regulator PhoU [Candidatus Lokiarchaeota archaeon]|nr:phosphate uptake regulator PhoU [Candidatus Lokiarchaeota archaeon]